MGRTPIKIKDSKTKRKVTSKEETKSKTAKSAPIKVKTTSKQQGNVTKKFKPSYEIMIRRALKNFGVDVLSSGICISKYIEANFPTTARHKRYLKLALKKGVNSGTFVQVRASYRLSAKAKARSSRKKKSSSRKTSKSTSPTRSKSKNDKQKEKVKKVKRSVSPKKTSKKATTEKKRSSKKEQKITKKPRKSSSIAKTTITTTPISKENTSITKVSGSKYDHVWHYEDHGWKSYDAAASDTVEDVYQNYLSNRGDTDVRAVKSGQWEYQVDFMAMKQTNIQHDNHTVRNIRRVKNG